MRRNLCLWLWSKLVSIRIEKCRMFLSGNDRFHIFLKWTLFRKFCKMLWAIVWKLRALNFRIWWIRDMIKSITFTMMMSSFNLFWNSIDWWLLNLTCKLIPFIHISSLFLCIAFLLWWKINHGLIFDTLILYLMTLECFKVCFGCI